MEPFGQFQNIPSILGSQIIPTLATESRIFNTLVDPRRNSSDHAKPQINLENMIFNQYQEFGQKQYVRSASESYLKLMPLINSINPSIYYELLVETLRECLHQISLDNFYNLVFNNYSPGFNFPAPINGKKVHNSGKLPFEKEGLTLCF